MSCFRFLELPEVVTQNVDDALIAGVDNKTVVVKAKAFEHVVTLESADGGQHHRPSLTLVFGDIDASVDTASINASGIDNIGVGGGDTDFEKTSGSRQQSVSRRISVFARVASQVVGVFANVKHTVDRSEDGFVATDFHHISSACDSFVPSLTFVVRILQTVIGGSEDNITGHGDVVDIEPIVTIGGDNGSKDIVDELVNARADEAVIVTLLAQTIVSGSAATVAGTHINDTVGILGHATDHQVHIAHLMPSDTKVVRLVDTAALSADVNFIRLVVENDSCRLTAHIVGAHANPIQRVIGCISHGRSLHCLEHVSRVDQSSVLVRAEAAHKGFRVVGLLARDIMSTLVSDCHRLT